MNKVLIGLGAGAVLLVFVLANTLFTVRETEQVLVLQFGQFQDAIDEPGLHVKFPFIQNVERFEKRILDVDPPVEQMILSDSKRLDVDSYVRYRITDPLLFRNTVFTEIGARDRLSRITIASLRSVLGNVRQEEVLSNDRSQIMDQVRLAVERESAQFGVEISDVRIVRADLPNDVRESVFNRITSERQRDAALARAEGDQRRAEIMADADRQARIIRAEADRDARVIQGEGDAKAIDILGAAFSRDPEFFSFVRTLQAYRDSLGQQDTTLVLSPDGDFFRYFDDLTGGGIGLSAGPSSLPAPALPELPGSGAIPEASELPFDLPGQAVQPQ